MGLFGLFYTMFIGGGYVAHSAKKAIENVDARKYHRNEELGTYTDTDGHMRIIENNHRATLYRESVGSDCIVFDLDDHKIYKNVTQERIDRAGFSGLTARPMTDTNFWDGRYNEKVKGYKFTDLETGRLLAMREVKGYHFLMDAETKMLIRMSDGERRREEFLRKHGKKKHHDLQKIMDEYNEEKKKLINKYGIDNWQIEVVFGPKEVSNWNDIDYKIYDPERYPDL